MKRLIDYPIEHIGFVVPDLEKTMSHITEIFGVKKFSIYEFSPTKAWAMGKEIPGYKLKIAMAVVENGSTGFEIIQPISPEGIHRDMAYSGKKGMNHIAFKVDDYDYWKEFFTKKGAQFIFESETEDELNGYRRCFYVKDEEEDLIYEIKEKAYFKDK
jgi:catechol 2,3-dioxygenase-like lactoylglutathione lyase family enzyme